MSATDYKSLDLLSAAELADMDADDLRALLASTEGFEDAASATPGGRMRMLRERKGISLRSLSAAIDTHFTTIAKLESGKMKMTLEWAQKVGAELGFPATAILASPDSAESARTIPVYDVADVDWVNGQLTFEVQQGSTVITIGGSRTFALPIEFEIPDDPAPGMVAVDPDDRQVRPGRIYLLKVDGNALLTLARYEPDPARFEVWIKYDGNVIDQVPVGGVPFALIGRVIHVSYYP